MWYNEQMKQIYILFGFIALIVVVGAGFLFVQKPQIPVGTVTPPPPATILPAPLPPPEIPPAPPIGNGGATRVILDANGYVTAKIGDTIEVKDMLVHVDRLVSDSRCPSGVQCIWAGEVKIGLTVEYLGATKKSTQYLELSTLSPLSFGDYDVHLDNVRPEKTGTLTSDADYRFTIGFIAHPAVTPAPTSITQGITGKLTVGPTCPVMRADQPCPDKPGVGVTIVAHDEKTGKVVAEAVTDANGDYAMPLPVGTYMLTGSEKQVYPRVTPGGPVGVMKNVVGTVNLTGDSGIR